MKIHDAEGFPNPDRLRTFRAEQGTFDDVAFSSVHVLGKNDFLVRFAF